MIRILGGEVELGLCLPYEEILLRKQAPNRTKTILLNLI
jgi:hypothetical protein